MLTRKQYELLMFIHERVRESGIPLSVCEVERVRRIEAMDEFKRAIDVAEELPFPRMVLHMGGSREIADPKHVV